MNADNPKMLLPRNYLSNSAMDLWNTDKKKFVKRYFEGIDDDGSEYTRFGSKIHKMIEEGLYKKLLPKLVVYPVQESSTTCSVGGVPVLIKMDTYHPDKNVFRDYKTSMKAWDLVKVQKHDQLVFYATALAELTGKIPPYAHIDWIETVREKKTKMGLHNEGELAVTGKVVSFKRVFEEGEIVRMRKLILKSALEISQAYKLWIQTI